MSIEMNSANRRNFFRASAALAFHFDICCDALDAGCAVFCEKTMCYSVEQARKLVALYVDTH